MEKPVKDYIEAYGRSRGGITAILMELHRERGTAMEITKTETLNKKEAKKIFEE